MDIDDIEITLDKSRLSSSTPSSPIPQGEDNYMIAGMAVRPYTLKNPTDDKKFIFTVSRNPKDTPSSLKQRNAEQPQHDFSNPNELVAAYTASLIAKRLGEEFHCDVTPKGKGIYVVKLPPTSEEVLRLSLDIGDVRRIMQGLSNDRGIKFEADKKTLGAWRDSEEGRAWLDKHAAPKHAERVRGGKPKSAQKSDSHVAMLAQQKSESPNPDIKPALELLITFMESSGHTKHTLSEQERERLVTATLTDAPDVKSALERLIKLAGLLEYSSTIPDHTRDRLVDATLSRLPQSNSPTP